MGYSEIVMQLHIVILPSLRAALSKLFVYMVWAKYFASAM